MGDLDDAIREHLGLRRQRGASEDEIARLEREALGPARPAGAAQDDAVLPEPAGRAEPAERPEPAAPEPEHAPEPPLEAGAPPTEEIVAVDEPEAGDLSDPTEDDDVLEATPDFLAETPEHDRLWFEQQPPRGFDFDDD